MSVVVSALLDCCYRAEVMYECNSLLPMCDCVCACVCVCRCLTGASVVR